MKTRERSPIPDLSGASRETQLPALLERTVLSVPWSQREVYATLECTTEVLPTKTEYFVRLVRMWTWLSAALTETPLRPPGILPAQAFHRRLLAVLMVDSQPFSILGSETGNGHSHASRDCAGNAVCFGMSTLWLSRKLPNSIDNDTMIVLRSFGLRNTSNELR